jgi:hypothetical protein
MGVVEMTPRMDGRQMTMIHRADEHPEAAGRRLRRARRVAASRRPSGLDDDEIVRALFPVRERLAVRVRRDPRGRSARGSRGARASPRDRRCPSPPVSARS